MKKLLLIILVALVAAVGWYEYSLRPADASDDVRRPVHIASGFSVSDIGAVLEQKGIIRSAWAFSLYARLHRTQAGLQAGDFLLPPSMDVPAIIDALKKGYAQEASITIPEGFTVSDIDALLSKKGLIAPGAFVLCAQTCDLSAYAFLPSSSALAKRGGRVEGYLFPDTYLVFSEHFDSKDFLDRLLENFRKRVVDGLTSDIAASHHSLNDIVTMASLIEDETRAGDERPIVAGILWKRLQAKTALGVDAAVRYILDKSEVALTASDLDTNSPYNLRKFRGLPPGPIGSPGLTSLSAALHPTDSPYWYYLHDANGQIHYAETNDEHNRNRALYLP